MRKITLFILMIALIGVACSNSGSPTSETDVQAPNVAEEVSAPTAESQELESPTTAPTAEEIQLTATSEPPISEPAPEGIDACAIFTQEDVEVLVGQSMEQGEAPIQGEGIGIVTSCAYQIEGTPWERASVIVRLLDNIDFSISFFAQSRQDNEEYLEIKTEDVAGVGDEAYWIGDIYNQLSVRKGTVHLLFSITGHDTVSEDYLTFVNQFLDRLP